MTGWRLGYIAAPEWVVKAIDSMQSHSTSNMTSFAQKGALAAYKGPQECVQEMLKEFDRRRKRVMEMLKEVPRISFLRPEGAFYVLINISGTGLKSTEFCERLLDKKKVAMVPGIAFGDDTTVRLSYTTSMENVEKGVERIAEFVKSL
jgi:aspartate aminotransferase